MYELQFVWRHSALIITSLRARWQSTSSSPQTVDISGETIKLWLAVGLLHVMYIECTEMRVCNFMLSLLWTGRGSLSISFYLLTFRAPNSVQKHSLVWPFLTQSAPWLCHVLQIPGHVVLSTASARILFLAQLVPAVLLLVQLVGFTDGYVVSFHADKSAGIWS
jgi:hypothetical protein